MIDDDLSLDERLKIFREHPLYKWPKITNEEQNHQKRGRKPGGSKRIVSKEQDHYKWWRT